MKLNKLTLIITLLLAFTSSLVATNHDDIEKHKKSISSKFNFNPNIKTENELNHIDIKANGVGKAYNSAGNLLGEFTFKNGLSDEAI